MNRTNDIVSDLINLRRALSEFIFPNFNPRLKKLFVQHYPFWECVPDEMYVNIYKELVGCSFHISSIVVLYWLLDYNEHFIVYNQLIKMGINEQELSYWISKYQSDSNLEPVLFCKPWLLNIAQNGMTFKK